MGRGVVDITITSFVPNILATGVLLSAVFIAAKALQRFDAIDVFWGLSITISVVVSAINLSLDGSLNPMSVLVVLPVALWALRLTNHIGRRFTAAKKQDVRYTNIIKKYTKRPHLRIFLSVYMLQAVLAVLVSFAAIGAMYAMNERGVTVWLGIGALMWIIGFMFEAVADYQLARYLRTTTTKAVFTGGLWRYSRHPNYFGELLMWWGFVIASIGSSYIVLALVGALTITVLIVGISGVPLAEKQGEKRTGWNTYKKSTSILFPLPPARNKSQ